MAVYNSIALGKARKSAGNVRFTIWKGIPVAAQKPASVANPRSPKQLKARSNFSAVVAVYRRIPAFADSVFSFMAIRQSAYNAFTSANNVVANLEYNVGTNFSTLPAENLVIANQNIVVGTASANLAGSGVDFTITNLPPDTEYVAIGAMGTTGGDYLENPTGVTFTTSGIGTATFSVSAISLGGAGSSTAFVVIQAVVSGLKYAYKADL